jgi:hypothetical protein
VVFYNFSFITVLRLLYNNKTNLSIMKKSIVILASLVLLAGISFAQDKVIPSKPQAKADKKEAKADKKAAKKESRAEKKEAKAQKK